MRSKLRIIILGSNPSQKSSSVTPFWRDTKSTGVVYGWLRSVEADNAQSMHFYNVMDQPTPGNRPLRISEIRANLLSLELKLKDLDDYKIVALGKTAEKALTLLGRKFYAMPHPSGLNRKLNDPKYVEEKINGLRDYLNPFKIE